MARELGIQFAEALEMAIDRGRPLPESASDIIENIDTPALHGWLRHFDIRDKLLLRAPQFEDLQSRARRFRKSGALSLAATYGTFRRGRSPRPSALKTAMLLRMQNDYLISRLSDFAKARISHAIEVSVSQRSIREAMCSLVGLAFTTSATNGDLPQTFVPAKEVFTQMLSVQASPACDATMPPKLTPRLREFEGLTTTTVENDYDLAVPWTGVSYDFSLDLSRGGVGLPASKAATLRNGDDIYRAMENAVLSGSPLPEFGRVPMGFLCGESECAFELNWQMGNELPSLLEQSLMSRLELFWEKGGHAEPCRSNAAGFADPDLWVQEAVRHDLARKLPSPLPIDEVFRTLARYDESGDPVLLDLVRAVFMSEVRAEGGKFYFPIGLFSPAPDAPPEKNRAYVRFDSEFFGRDSYNDLTRNERPQAGAVQVFDVAPRNG